MRITWFDYVLSSPIGPSSSLPPSVHNIIRLSKFLGALTWNRSSRKMSVLVGNCRYFLFLIVNSYRCLYKHRTVFTSAGVHAGTQGMWFYPTKKMLLQVFKSSERIRVTMDGGILEPIRRETDSSPRVRKVVDIHIRIIRKRVARHTQSNFQIPGFINWMLETSQGRDLY